MNVQKIINEYLGNTELRGLNSIVLREPDSIKNIKLAEEKNLLDVFKQDIRGVPDEEIKKSKVYQDTLNEILLDKALKLYTGHKYYDINKALRNPKKYYEESLGKKPVSDLAFQMSVKNKEGQKLLIEQDRIKTEQESIKNKMAGKPIEEIISAIAEYQNKLADLSSKYDNYIDSLLPLAQKRNTENQLGMASFIEHQLSKKGERFDPVKTKKDYSMVSSEAPSRLPEKYLYRGISRNSPELRDEYINQLRNGIVVDNGFISTTTDMNVAKHFGRSNLDKSLQLLIDLEASTEMPYWAKNVSEAEWLYPSGTKFELLKEETIDGIPYLTVSAHGSQYPFTGYPHLK